MAVDGSGNVYVVDNGNHRIQKFTSSGTYLTQWGSYGSGDGQFNYPYGVAVDASGNVYVADLYNHRIQVFTSSGTYLTQWGTQGSGPGSSSTQPVSRLMPAAMSTWRTPPTTASRCSALCRCPRSPRPGGASRRCTGDME